MAVRHADRFVAVLDACVLAPALQRNVLLSLAAAGLFRPRWSADILAETARAIERITGEPHVGTVQVGRMCKAFPEGEVDPPERLPIGLEGIDEKDRHVAGAAVHCGAAAIVTDNLKDFPASVLDAHDILAVSGDDFAADCIDLYQGAAVGALRTMRERFEKPSLDTRALLTLLAARGMSETAAVLRGFEGSL